MFARTTTLRKLYRLGGFAIVNAAILLTFASRLPAQTATQNLIRNGGFEDDTNADGQPDNWQFDWKMTHSGDQQRAAEKQQPDVSLDGESPHAGRHSIRVGVVRPKDDGVWTQDGIRHIAGTHIYRVSAAIQAKGMKDTDARVAIVFLGAGGKWLAADYGAIVVTSDCEWTHFAGYVTAPKGTERLRIRCWLNMHNTGVGTAWFDSVELVPTTLTEMPGMQYVDDSPMPPLSPANQRKGYVVFRRNPLRLVFPATVPPSTDIDQPLTDVASQGESKSLSFGVRAVRPLTAVRTAVSDLTTKGNRSVIPAANVRVRPIRYLPKLGQSRWGPFADSLLTVPLFLQNGRAVDIAASTSHWFWVDIQVPDDASAGTYHGHVTLLPEGGDKTDIPISLQVQPFKLLEPPDAYFGMYCKTFRDLSLFRNHCRDMREHGMTTLGLCCSLGGDIARNENGKVAVTFDGTGVFEQAMDIYCETGFPAPIAWLMGSDVVRWCLKQGKLESREFAECYRQVVEAILAESKRRGWSEIIFQPIDEPFEHTSRLETAKRCLEILKQIPGVRTEEDGPNGNPSTLEELYASSDILVYHDGPVLQRRSFDAAGWERFLQRLHSDGKEVWFYNIDLTGWHPEVMRFGYGFGLWQSGGTGMIQWCYDYHRDGQPETAYRPGSMTFAYPSTDTETGGPTTGWQAVREGVSDFKYLYTLVCRLEERGVQPDSREAEIRDAVLQFLEQIDFRGSRGSAAQGDWTGPKGWSADGIKVASGDWKMANGLTFDGYDHFRRQLADWVVELGPPTRSSSVPLATLIRKWRRPVKDFTVESH